MIKNLTILAITIALSGCMTTPSVPPVVSFEPQIVNVPVTTFPEIPVVDEFDSHVMMLTETSSDGDVAKAYKSDFLVLLQRDKMFLDFLNTYRKAKKDAEARTK